MKIAILMILLSSFSISPTEREKPIQIETFRSLWLKSGGYVYEQWGYCSTGDTVIPIGTNNFSVPMCSVNIPPQVFKKGKHLNVWKTVVKVGETSMWVVHTN